MTEMVLMFSRAPAFNGAIGGWNVASVRLMQRMFWGAVSFNQDLASWDVHNVRIMLGMFDGASSFDQNLCSWGPIVGFYAGPQQQFGGMFPGTACPAQEDPDRANVPLGPFCHVC